MKQGYTKSISVSLFCGYMDTDSQNLFNFVAAKAIENSEIKF